MSAFTVIGRANGKEYRKEVQAHNTKEALGMVIMQKHHEYIEQLGVGSWEEIKWEVEDDFL